LFLGQSAFPVEMILKERNVRFAWILLGPELLVGRQVHCRGLDLCGVHGRWYWTDDNVADEEKEVAVK
jgi:hypothetical protein